MNTMQHHHFLSRLTYLETLLCCRVDSHAACISGVYVWRCPRNIYSKIVSDIRTCSTIWHQTTFRLTPGLKCCLSAVLSDIQYSLVCAPLLLKHLSLGCGSVTRFLTDRQPTSVAHLFKYCLTLPNFCFVTFSDISLT